MSELDASPKTIRVGVADGGSMFCIGFAPQLSSSELRSLEAPTAQYAKIPEGWGWPSQHIFSPIGASEMVLAMSHSALEDAIVTSVKGFSLRMLQEQDPRLIPDLLTGYAQKLALQLGRKYISELFVATISPNGSQVAFEELPDDYSPQSKALVRI